ncbi:glycosyltransferase [Psychroserpens sp. Hel_I_66]|uniref:glycosyltransferase n=1 Tax=Psychroserpens sp. Hel_I_66 TaxID=1250004 RepID=UPI00068F7F5B|nr:glycosyltransferase [Psychroserpens sp. Hel_I_66]
MEKKKLCVLAISLSSGGAERVISLLLKNLVHDFDVTLILLSNNIFFKTPKNLKIICLGKPEVLDTTSPFSKLKNMAQFVFKYRAIAKSEKFDVVMSFLALPNIINGMVTTKLTPKPKTIISERCFPTKMYDKNNFAMRVAKTFYPRYYNKTDVLFSNSLHINKDLKDNFGIKIPTELIYNPIEIDDQKTHKDSYKLNEQFKVISVGSHTPAKNQILLLKAVRHLNSGYSLTIPGAGPLTDELNNFAEKNNLENQLNLPGSVTNVKDYLLQNDCFVLSSNTEGFPNVLLEAMAAGLPVISTNCLSGPLEILNDNEPVSIPKGEFYLAKYGILINTEDDLALSKAILFLRNHKEDRKKYSDLGFQKAQNFSLPKIYEQVKQLINNQTN